MDRSRRRSDRLSQPFLCGTIAEDRPVCLLQLSRRRIRAPAGDHQFLFRSLFSRCTRRPVPENPASQLKDIAGTYESTRRDDTTRFKLSTLFGQRSASVDKDGVLTINGTRDLRNHPIKWKPTGKDLWQAEGDQSHLFAIRDSRSKVVRLAVDFPGVQLQRVPWYENYRWVLIALWSSIGILALVILASILRTWRRVFQRKRPRPEPQPGTIWLTAAPRLAAFLWVIFVCVLLGYFAIKGDDIMPPTPAWFKWFVAQNLVAMVAIILSALAVVAGIDAWSRNISVITKLKFSFVALACAFLSWFAIDWHIIGPTHRI